MGVTNPDASILSPVEGRVFHFFVSLHHPTILLKIYIFFICPSSNLVAKKLFSGRQNIGGAFSHLAPPPSYVYAGIVIYVYNGLVRHDATAHQ